MFLHVCWIGVSTGRVVEAESKDLVRQQDISSWCDLVSHSKDFDLGEMGKSLENFELKCSMRWFTSFEYHSGSCVGSTKGRGRDGSWDHSGGSSGAREGDNGRSVRDGRGGKRKSWQETTGFPIGLDNGLWESECSGWLQGLFGLTS